MLATSNGLMASMVTLLFFDLQSTCRLPIAVSPSKKHIHLANVLHQEIHVLPHVVARVVKIPMATVLCLVSIKGKYMCGRHTILQVQPFPWAEVKH